MTAQFRRPAEELPVPRSTRLALALVTPLLLTALAACGDDTGGDDTPTGGGLDSLTVEGDLGTSPEVTFDGQVEVSKIETKTLITGDGAEVARGRRGADPPVDRQRVQPAEGPRHLRGQEARADHRRRRDRQGLQRRPWRARPSAPGCSSPRRRWTRSARPATPPLGIGNKDTVIMVVDLASGVLEAPQGTEKDAPDWTPDDRRQGRRARQPRLRRHARAGRPPADRPAGAG